MENFNDKKDRIKRQQAKAKKHKQIIFSSFLGLVLLIVGAVVLLNQESIPGLDSKYSIGKSINYANQKIEMTEVSSTVEGGKIRLALADVEKNSLVYTTYDTSYDLGDGQKGLPLMAYLTPAGRVMVAISFCEPCFSRSFHIDGDDLVCNSCFTRWALSDLSGLSGGCVKYPPAELPYIVNEDTGEIIIDENLLKEWSPRDV